jgi:hypothetical protein
MESCSFYYRFLIKPALANLSMVSGITEANVFQVYGFCFACRLVQLMHVPSSSIWLLGQ